MTTKKQFRDTPCTDQSTTEASGFRAASQQQLLAGVHMLLLDSGFASDAPYGRYWTIHDTTNIHKSPRKGSP